MKVMKTNINVLKQHLKKKFPPTIFKILIFTRHKFTKESFAYVIMRFFRIKKNKIVICNMFGSGFGDNPKYIALELMKNSKNDIVWLVNDLEDNSIPKAIRKVKYGSLRSYYELSTAKIWIDNARKSIATIKKKNQFYMHTGHGGVPLKKVEAAAEEIDPTYIIIAQHDSEQIDLMISNSEMKTRILKEDYWYTGEIGVWGSPKIEALTNYDEEINRKIKENYGIDKCCKILLYAPTFRQEGNLELVQLDYNKLKSELQKKYGGDWIIFIRLHPLIAGLASELNLQNVVNVTDYPDMQELLTAVDLLITDYSGTMFEMLQISKPVFLYVPDMREYERGFYFGFEELPFPIAESEKELIEVIKQFSVQDYNKKIEEFKKKIGLIETKISAKKCAERIEIEMER